jgi:2-phosphoglycerate kinase
MADEKPNDEQLKQNLAHVFWMGGSPCSGKSSIAGILAGKYGLEVYHCDDAFFEHAKRVDPREQPVFHSIIHMTWDEIWMRPVDVQIADEFACYREEFAMIISDLLAYPQSTPVIAEGAALLPDCVSELLLDRCRAIWVVPTEAFQRQRYTPEHRPWMWDILNQCADPERAFRNWMDRDVGFAKQIVKRAQTLEIEVIEVDGTRSIAENAESVAEHFHLMDEGKDR